MSYTWFILQIIIILIDCSSTVLIFHVFFDSKKVNMNNIIVFYGVNLLYVLLYTIFDFEFNNISTLIFMFYVIVYNSDNIIIKIKNYTLTIVILGLLGYIIDKIIYIIAPEKNMPELNIINSSRIYLGVVLSCLTILFIKNFKEQILNKFNPYKRSILLILGIVILFLSGLTAYYSKTDYSIESFELLLTLIYVGTLIIVVTVLFLYSDFYKRLKVEYELTRKLEIERLTGNYIADVSEKTSELVSLRHDIGHHFIVLEGYLKDGLNEEALKYLHKIDKPYQSAGSVVVTENRVVAAILTDKKTICEHLDIQLYIQTSIQAVQIMETEISSIIGNLLSNAIEAVQKIEETDKRYIEFSMISSDLSLVIKCENPFIETPKVFMDRFISTKKDPRYHGIGLKNVRDIVDRYNGYINYVYKNNIFNVILEIYF